MEIFGVNEELVEKEMRNRQIYSDFLAGNVSFRVIQATHSCSREVLLLLTKAKELFQTQLPKMPREYVLKQVFNTKHKTMCMFYKDTLVGSICFRPFSHQRFCEVVFFSIDFQSQIRGNGGFMMCLFKEYFKSELSRHSGGCKKTGEPISIDSEVLRYSQHPFPAYFMTYADNSAIGFFKKQGFSKKIRFGGWVGYIKDYEGGTLMECQVFWEINYLNSIEAIENVKKRIFKELSEEPTYGPICCNDSKPKELLGLLEKTSSSGAAVKSKRKIIDDFFGFLFADLSSNASAWPFLQPVSAKDVPDYYRVIKNPMDLSEMHRRIMKGTYKCLKDFETDFFLIISNCYHYNGSTTQYNKCAQNLEAYYQKRIQQYKNKPFLRGTENEGFSRNSGSLNR